VGLQDAGHAVGVTRSRKLRLPLSFTRPMPVAGLQDVGRAAVATGSGTFRLRFF